MIASQIQRLVRKVWKSIGSKWKNWKKNSIWINRNESDLEAVSKLKPVSRVHIIDSNDTRWRNLLGVWVCDGCVQACEHVYVTKTDTQSVSVCVCVSVYVAHGEDMCERSNAWEKKIKEASKRREKHEHGEWGIGQHLMSSVAVVRRALKAKFSLEKVNFSYLLLKFNFFFPLSIRCVIF